MPTVQYTALRSLYGVSSGVTVTYELPIRYAGMTPSKKNFGTTRVSMAGRRERYHERTERSYAMTTKPLTEPQYKQLKMFLDSCDREESFLFSPDASAFSTAYLATLDYDELLAPERDSMRSYNFSIDVP